MFRGLNFEDCLFDEAVLTHVVFEACTFRRCSFDGADLSEALLGAPGRRTHFIDSTFRATVMDLIEVGHAAFSGCRIEPEVLIGADFEDVPIRQTIFGGTIGAVWFSSSGRSEALRRALVDVDFSGARMTDVHFVDLDLSLVELPPSGFEAHGANGETIHP